MLHVHAGVGEKLRGQPVDAPTGGVIPDGECGVMHRGPFATILHETGGDSPPVRALRAVHRRPGRRRSSAGSGFAEDLEPEAAEVALAVGAREQVARGAGDGAAQVDAGVPAAAGVADEHVSQVSASPPGRIEWPGPTPIGRSAGRGVKERRPGGDALTWETCSSATPAAAGTPASTCAAPSPAPLATCSRAPTASATSAASGSRSSANPDPADDLRRPGRRWTARSARTGGESPPVSWRIVAKGPLCITPHSPSGMTPPVGASTGCPRSFSPTPAWT